MQLQREKDAGKINYCNVTVILNADFEFDFFILQKYLKIKFLTLPSSKKAKKIKQSFFN